jgi:hypothetical protein
MASLPLHTHTHQHASPPSQELVPDLVEKFFDPVTNTVRVKRRFTVVETQSRFSWRTVKTVILSSAKYHDGPGGVDPALQPTYALSEVSKHADSAINAAGTKYDVEDKRQVLSPMFPASAFSGFARR